MQALYRHEVVEDAVADLDAEIAALETASGEVAAYARKLLNLVAANRDTIDDVLSLALDKWDLKRVAVTDRCVLRMGVAELLFEPETPTRVVLDEAIEIAKQFGSAESGRFVNGVLDRVARDHRGE